MRILRVQKIGRERGWYSKNEKTDGVVYQHKSAKHDIDISIYIPTKLFISLDELKMNYANYLISLGGK